MAQYGMLREYKFVDVTEDIRGSHLYGRDDEKLGKIKDVIFDHATAQIMYVIVDTGGWLSTKEFVVPANRLRASAKHQDDFEADLTKAQVESFPPYKETDLESDQQWADYENRYRAKWVADPVMHRAGTDRDITPTTQQLEGNRNSELAAERASGSNVASARPVSGLGEVDTGAFEQGGYAASTDTVHIDVSATGIGPRWDTFQDRLRERRKEVIAPVSDGDQLRKAS
ncbi:MAG TPA: PRC-barrel domain-containing protein [Candidatus Binatia bacterium]|nr:PRC-barrel domain-containing protein [Candidatus Binatia bacterium]